MLGWGGGTESNLAGGGRREGVGYRHQICSAIPETLLLDASSSGTKGFAFTGAFIIPSAILRSLIGHVFPNESATCPFALQAKQLRFLQERSSSRPWADSNIPSMCV